MSTTPTPRTDAALEWVRPVGNDSGPPHEQYVEANFARDLERENAAFRAIIDATLSALPVGNVRTHTPDSIPERVGDLVKAHADELADSEQLRKDKARLRAAWGAARSYIDNYGTDPITPTMWKTYNDYIDKCDAIDAAMEGDK
jgi:hypothetical protein